MAPKQRRFPPIRQPTSQSLNHRVTEVVQPLSYEISQLLIKRQKRQCETNRRPHRDASLSLPLAFIWIEEKASNLQLPESKSGVSTNSTILEFGRRYQTIVRRPDCLKPDPPAAWQHQFTLCNEAAWKLQPRVDSAFVSNSAARLDASFILPEKPGNYTRSTMGWACFGVG